MRLFSLCRTAARILLGLFVLGQTLFLLTANAVALLNLSPHAVGRLLPFLRQPAEDVPSGDHQWSVLSTGKNVSQRWADLTGQAQSWSLFAPDVADYVPFVELELRWDRDEPPRQLPSLNVPRDRRCFFRLGNFRFRRYESTIDFPPMPGWPFDPSGADWGKRLASALRDRQDYILTYLGWRLKAFRHENPHLPPPAEVILSEHLYGIPAPPGPESWDWHDLGVHRVARWRPGSARLDVYDPRTDDFGPAERSIR